jgi:hypothetical protein
VPRSVRLGASQKLMGDIMHIELRVIHITNFHFEAFVRGSLDPPI